MAEPSSGSLVAAAVIGAGLLVNGEAAIGALCGGIIYFVASAEISIWTRMALTFVSVVMGYISAPMLATVEVLGIGPLDMPGPAAFVASSGVVTVTLAAIKAKRATTGGQKDG
ncbi:hypothetical protein GCM10022421_08830 [Oceanisphaera sediminis]|uniref:Phage holin n=1 Tax=Oceanisphaera sediminis TaxID=981381 RepID=A0ABP7DIN6_9GAMM